MVAEIAFGKFVPMLTPNITFPGALGCAAASFWHGKE